MNKLINKISILSITTSILLASCSLKDYTPVVTVNVPSEAPALVPNMYIEDGVALSMFVGKTQDVLAVNKKFIVNNATIELYENDVLKNGWIKSNGVDTSFYYNPTLKPTPGNIYRTNVSAPGLPSAQAIDTMPLPVIFSVLKTGKTITFEDKEGKGPFGGGTNFIDTLVEVKLTFTDDANKKNYYRILVNEDAISGKSINQERQNKFGVKHPIHSTDIVYQGATEVGFGGSDADIIDLPAGFFTDVTFNGKIKQIIFYVPVGRVPDYINNDLGYDKAYFSLQHLSRSAYLHASSAASYNNEDGLFSQPSLVFSNYKNGFGILGCNTASVQGIQVR